MGSDPPPSTLVGDLLEVVDQRIAVDVDRSGILDLFGISHPVLLR
jgi:hypothetical protein